MNTSNELVALIAAAFLGFVVRFFTVVIEWMAKALNVKEPTPMKTPVERILPPKD